MSNVKPHKRMPSALLLDLDDTLIDNRGAMADAVVLFRRMHGLCRGEADRSLAERWDKVGRDLWRRMSTGEVGFIEQRRIRLKTTFGLVLSDLEADTLFDSYLAFYESSWRLMLGAEDFLLQTSHLPRAIVTNGHGTQARQKLDKLSLTNHFQAIDCGARKPDLRIFAHALKLLGVEPVDAMMIGDDEETDIAPAVALGMKVFHVNPTASGRSIQNAAHAA